MVYKYPSSSLPIILLVLPFPLIPHINIVGGFITVIECLDIRIYSLCFVHDFPFTLINQFVFQFLLSMLFEFQFIFKPCCFLVIDFFGIKKNLLLFLR